MSWVSGNRKDGQKLSTIFPLKDQIRKAEVILEKLKFDQTKLQINKKNKI